MARGQVFEVSRKTARGYNVPRGRPLRSNGAGVTAIMGLTNGVGAAERRRRAKRALRACRDMRGKFVSCKEACPNRRRDAFRGSLVHEDDIADRIRSKHPRWSVKKRVKAIRAAVRRASGRGRSTLDRAPTRGSIKGRRGGATCWKKPRTKYVKLGAVKRSDYAYPECWAYPIHGKGPWTRRLVPRAIKWFRVHQGKYTPSVRAKIAARIEAAARKLGLKSGLRTRSRRARRNEGAGDMSIEFASPNRRRRGRRSRRRGRRTGYGRRSMLRRMRRNAGFGMSSSSGDGMDVFNSNRRGRGRRRSKKRGRRRGKSRRSFLRRRGRFSRRRGMRMMRRGRGRRRVSRGRRRSARRGGKSMRRGRGRRFRRNALSKTWDEPWELPSEGRWATGFRAPAETFPSSYTYETRGSSSMGYDPLSAFPYLQARRERQLRAKEERKQRRAARLSAARPAVLAGITGKDLRNVIKDMTRSAVESMFPDYGTFRTWSRAMHGDKKFRRWSRRARMSSFRGRRWGKGRRYGRGRRRWFGKKSRRRGFRKLRRRMRGRFGRRGGRGRMRRWMRGRRRFRRNFTANLPYASNTELVLAGVTGLATFGIIQVATKMISQRNPMLGAISGLVMGALAAFGADAVFTYDPYAKAASMAGVLSMVMTAWRALGGVVKQASAGFGAVNYAGTAARYVPAAGMGAFYQAQAGLGAPFQQALAAPFYQAQAGFGEYVAQPLQGTGEYVAQDGSLAPVSDFGEYVANRLNVEGYGDYEVQGSYATGADGFGMVADGVRPNANLDREFDVIEAAAGLGAAGAAPRSDYIPTVGSSNVSSGESAADSGIFDVGGPNGVFG